MLCVPWWTLRKCHTASFDWVKICLSHKPPKIYKHNIVTDQVLWVQLSTAVSITTTLYFFYWVALANYIVLIKNEPWIKIKAYLYCPVCYTASTWKSVKHSKCGNSVLTCSVNRCFSDSTSLRSASKKTWLVGVFLFFFFFCFVCFSTCSVHCSFEGIISKFKSTKSSMIGKRRGSELGNMIQIVSK